MNHTPNKKLGPALGYPKGKPWRPDPELRFVLVTFGLGMLIGASAAVWIIAAVLS